MKKVLVFKDIKNKRWTIWDQTKKKHLGYAHELTLTSCVFVVDEQKRKKVLKTSKRFPHAWIVGTLLSKEVTSLKNQVIYSPFEMSTFQYKKSKKQVKTAKLVTFNSIGQVFI